MWPLSNSAVARLSEVRPPFGPEEEKERLDFGVTLEFGGAERKAEADDSRWKESSGGGAGGGGRSTREQ